MEGVRMRQGAESGKRQRAPVTVVRSKEQQTSRDVLRRQAKVEVEETILTSEERKSGTTGDHWAPSRTANLRERDRGLSGGTSYTKKTDWRVSVTSSMGCCCCCCSRRRAETGGGLFSGLSPVSRKETELVGKTHRSSSAKVAFNSVKDGKIVRLLNSRPAAVSILLSSVKI